MIKKDLKKDVTVINAGVSGSTTSDGLSRLKWYMKKKPSLVFVALGANDGLRGLDLEKSQKNLEEIIEYAKNSNAKVLLAGMLIPPNYGPEYSESFKKMYQELKKKYDLKTMPFLLKGVAGEKELNLADGIHPNAEGHKIIAENVFIFLKEELQMLELKSLKKSYLQGSENIEIFENLNFHLEEGEMVAIMGKSGSGKSTLLSLISGIIKPNSGEIVLNSVSYKELNEEQINDFRATNIGFIFQNFHLVSYLNALENVMLPAKVCNIAHPKERAIELLTSVGLSHRLKHLPSELSGGEKQRVAIARSLIHNPKIILADEPSGNLDDETGNSVMDILFELVEKNRTTLILVTHSKDVASRCEKIYKLSSGNLVQC
eukprot:TRINITY_DN65526_c0_g1_i1.p1 TRINITY_DN65526_c0_g1~~TRINITY_DN65526_c0_g1_i1.p1  ORF type:complete len:413 (+),score=30.55 TRINITY_DN65526_c0_g1_i1:118-1239(+)